MQVQTSSRRVLAGLLLFIGGAEFLTVMMVGEAIAPGYSAHSQPISDLGVISQTADMFNLSVMILGVLLAAAGYLLYRDTGRVSILVTLAIAGFGTFFVAIFTLNSGIHGLFALTAFVFVPLAAIACSFAVTSPTKYVFWALAIWSFIGLVLHIFEINGPLGEGGMERFFVCPSMLFVLAFGGYLLAKGELTTHASK